MLLRVMFAALLAGMAAGFFATAAQALRVTPLIVEAERYESAGDAAHGGEAGAHSPGAHAGETAWAPRDGAERTFYTLLSNLAAGAAFSLLLTGAILLAGQNVSVRSGLVWGACGFAAFVLAPSFGLPPELPGMAGAGLEQRQLWWALTAATTAAGLWLFAFRRGPLWMLAGLALVLSMHAWGAPQPADRESAVPAWLAAEFAVATVATSAVYWLVLGGLLGWLLGRATDEAVAGRAAP